jgi:hypothetical protein
MHGMTKNKEIVGFQLELSIIITSNEEGDLKSLMEDVEEYIEYNDEEYVLKDFNITPIYVDEDDDEPS